ADDVRYAVAFGLSTSAGTADSSLLGPRNIPGQPDAAQTGDSLRTASTLPSTAPQPPTASPARSSPTDAPAAIPVPMSKPMDLGIDLNPQLVVPQQSVDPALASPPADTTGKKPK
ncbi:MAG: hypothetical protein ACKOB6_00220, partial [Candidatus Kapaibacterium sp.]